MIPDGDGRTIEQHEYAGLVSRVTALAVDVALVTTVVTLGTAAFTAAVTAFMPDAAGLAKAGAAGFAVSFPFLYFALMWSVSGQTVGDMILGIRVVRSDGGAIGLMRSVVRSAVGLVLAIPFLIGMLTVLTNPERRALHDRVFGTAVVYQKGPIELRKRSGGLHEADKTEDVDGKPDGPTAG